MNVPINQSICLNVSGIPATARRITATITRPASGGTVTIEGQPGYAAGATGVALTPDALGTWSYTWSARDLTGLEVGTATGTFEVVEPPAFAPAAMTATVVF